MSLKSLSIVAAAALALCAGAAQSATQNGFANGGFEIAGVDNPALAWKQADAGYQLSSDAHTGSFSMLLQQLPQSSPRQANQNSRDNGILPIMPPLTVGDAPEFSFWAKGSTLFTANAQYFLQYLDDVGNIKYNSGSQQFQGQLKADEWTKITVAGVVVPDGATAALVRFVTAAGPVHPFDPPNSVDSRVYIDDVYLGVAAIPEPSTYALMLLGLAGVGLLAKRRRQA